MYRHFIIVLLMITPFVSFSQEEKGCGIFSYFNVKYGQTPSGSANTVLFCNGMFTTHCSVDSVFIDLDLNEDKDVIMKWTYRNELSTGGPDLTGELVEWYHNDSLIDPSLYFVDDYVSPGPCGDQRKAEVRMETRTLGTYRLRKTLYEMDLAVIVLREKAAAIVEAEEVSLKIYPNPSSNIVFIEHGEVNSTEVMLQSIDGKILDHPFLEISGGTTRIDTSHLPSGSYILTFSSDKHETVRKKISLI